MLTVALPCVEHVDLPVVRELGVHFRLTDPGSGRAGLVLIGQPVTGRLTWGGEAGCTLLQPLRLIAGGGQPHGPKGSLALPDNDPLRFAAGELIGGNDLPFTVDLHRLEDLGAIKATASRGAPRRVRLTGTMVLGSGSAVPIALEGTARAISFRYYRAKQDDPLLSLTAKGTVTAGSIGLPGDAQRPIGIELRCLGRRSPGLERDAPVMLEP